MARSSTTLRNQLVSAGNKSTEADAIEAWAESYTKYFEAASSNGVPITVLALRTPGTGPKAAMKLAMTGLSSGTANALPIQAGIAAFWTALATLPASYFTGATLITPPPGLTAIAADVMVAAAKSVEDGEDATTALGYIAGGGAGGAQFGIHSLTTTGATATFPGPTVSPIS